MAAIHCYLARYPDDRLTVVALTSLDARCARLFREHPFYQAPDMVPVLRRLLSTDEFRRVTDPA